VELPKETRKAFIHLARIYETTGIEEIRKECMHCIGKFGRVYGSTVNDNLTGCYLCEKIVECNNCWIKVNGEKCHDGINRETLYDIRDSIMPWDIRKAFISRAKHIRSEIRKCEEREE